MTHPENCLNCFAELQDRDKFCYNCGQSALNTHTRITMSHISHEVVHALTHADKGLFFLIKELAIRPGITIKEYLAGKHKKYFSPFSFFFIVLGFYVLFNSTFKPFDSAMDLYSSGSGQTVYPASIKTERQKAKYIKLQARVAKAMNFMNTRINLVLCISTPFIAFIMFLLYNRHLYYAEHLVVMTFVNTFLNLLSIGIFMPLFVVFRGSGDYQIIATALFLTHIVYVSIVYFSVLNMPSTLKGYLKCIGSVLLALGGWTLICATTIAGYIIYGAMSH
jgi:hypothetical protein